MSEKKGKKGKGKSSAGDEGGDDSLKPGEKSILDEVATEIYEMKIRDLVEKLARSKEKFDLLLGENDTLAKQQKRTSHDKQDIVEFLNIKVQEHEKHITTLDEKIAQLEQERKEIEQKLLLELDTLSKLSESEKAALSATCAKYKAELDTLADFRAKKDDMELMLITLNRRLELKEKEFKDLVHSMERKVLQDKNQMKKEMLHKVNEAVANFRRVADQQMAETTKRAIRENMAITSQLKKMSAKTIDLISENEQLNQKVNKLKTVNSLLTDSEQSLAKKNHANQKVIKMLVEKLKESDAMLELAYANGELEDPYEEEYDIYNPPTFDESDENSVNAPSVKIQEELEELPEGGGSTNNLTESNYEFAEEFGMEDSSTPNLSENFNQSSESVPVLEANLESSNNAIEQNEQFQKQQPTSTDERKSSVSAKFNPLKTKHKDISPILAAISRTKNAETLIEVVAEAVKPGENQRCVAVQTKPLQFGEHVTSKYLLGDVRPWGPPASCLPKNGVGLYVAKRSLPTLKSTRIQFLAGGAS